MSSEQPKRLQLYLSKISDKFAGIHNLGIFQYQWNWYKIAGVIASVAAGVTMRKILDIVWRKWNNYPPGPCGLPIFGSYFWCKNYYYIASLMNMYGSVTMINFGLKRLIFIDDIKMVKTLFNRKEGANRGHNILINNPSLSEIDGKKFVFRRQMLHKSFVTVLDSNYLNKIGISILEPNLFKYLDEAIKENKSIHLFDHTKYAVFALLFATIFGDYLSIPSKQSNEYKQFNDGLTKSLNEFSKYHHEGFLFQDIPFYKWWLDNMWRPNYIKTVENVTCIVNEWVDKALKLRDNNTSNIDVCIKPMISALKTGKMTEKELKSDVQTMLVGGIHTTALFLSEAMVICAKYQDIQQSIYNEVKRFQDKYGSFKLQNVEEYPILRALIHENLRFASFSTFHGIARVIKNNNIMIDGYNVPKGSIIWGFYTKIMHQQQYGNWKNPTAFDLDNFLFYDEDNNINNKSIPKFKLNPNFAAFGVGRRNCPGSSLAKREIYLLLGRILLRYKILPTHDGYDDIPNTIEGVKNPENDLHRKLIAKSVKVIKR